MSTASAQGDAAAQVEVQEQVQMQEEVPEQAQEPIAAPARTLDDLHCAADRERGSPWAALDTLLARSPIRASFVHGPIPVRFACPPHFELVQTRPWERDSLALEPATLGELYEFVGRDPSTGDVIQATIGRLNAAPESDLESDQSGLDRRAYFRVVPEEPSRPLALLGEGLDPGRWYSLRFAVRSPITVEKLSEWLGEHPGEVVDVVRLASADREAWGAVRHHHVGTTVTICARKYLGPTPCWTRDDIIHSALRAESDYWIDFELTPREGPTETWRLDDELTLRPSEGTTTDPSVWRATEPGSAATLVVLEGLERLRTIRPGYVDVGHYAEIGHAIIHRAPITSWILRQNEDGGAWTAIPTPELVLREVIPLKSALAVVESRQLLTAASVDESLRVLGFASTPTGWSFVGQIPPPLGEESNSPLGRYSWRHRIEVSGDTCLRLRPGPYEGVTEDLETEVETDVGPRARRRLKATSGRWTISADGIRKGC